jgi:hypothetical protein
MIARVTTWLFYAVVFFFLGVWASPHVPSVRETMTRGWDGVKGWAQGTIATPTMRGESVATRAPAVPTPTPAAAAPPVSAPPVSAPAAAPPAQLATVARARAAFADGDVNRAISLYRERARQAPEDADALGELGNVLMTSGRLQESAQAFYDAGMILLKRGEVARARMLAPIVRRGNPQLANDLETQAMRKAQDGAPAPRG